MKIKSHIKTEENFSLMIVFVATLFYAKYLFTIAALAKIVFKIM